MNSSYVNQFQQTYLFRDFTEHELHELFKGVRKNTVAAGDSIFESDAQGSSLFLIHYGSIRIEGLGPSGSVELTSHKSMGSLIGENAFLHRLPRFVSAIATEKSELFEIGFRELEGFLEANPAASIKFYAAFSRHLSESLYGLVQEVMRVHTTQQVHASKYSF